jgi:hypothetical protein
MEEEEQAINELQEIGVDAEPYAGSDIRFSLCDLSKPAYGIRFIHKLANPSGFEESWEIKASGTDLPEMARQIKKFNNTMFSTEEEEKENVAIRRHR